MSYLSQSAPQNDAGVNSGHLHLFYIIVIIIFLIDLTLLSTNSIVKLQRSLTWVVYTELIYIQVFSIGFSWHVLQWQYV